ncbi:hypothetical protein Tco_1231146 [Tanacetum coccineum]
MEKKQQVHNKDIGYGTKAYGSTLCITAARVLVYCDGIIVAGEAWKFVSFKEMTTSQLQGKLWLYDEVHDNIIPEPDVTLDLAKSMSLPEVAEEEAARQVHATHESKKISRRQPNTGSSSEGTGTKPGVPNESTVTPITSSEETGTKPGVLDEENDTLNQKPMFTLDWDQNRRVHTHKKMMMMLKIIECVDNDEEAENNEM